MLGNENPFYAEAGREEGYTVREVMRGRPHQFSKAVVRILFQVTCPFGKF